ncbi:MULTISPECIES: transketolase [unclassified Marinobacter]|uniref:transketolase n=1 Tax=unclassified Marinobacter TaxID=83889 RepID=UPI00200DDF89|nr:MULTISPECIES: transketolase [unclassified Marinobacter]UQG57997.1 transketolase [Marinobacter sp. M4C]UQG66802.1 transketolase [Marinobacter sp. M2C]UQG71082.1 transketolase [Marinobacter sp. M1C]
MSSSLDLECINTLRFLSVDMIQQANSGHPGLPLGAATMAYALWTGHLKHHPANPHWPDRDRFVLSAGHGSALLYSLLHVTGYDLSLDDLKQFRQWGSKAPGHPERGHTPGVEITTGPLGQGLANAVGMAIAEAHLAACYNRDGHLPIDHRTWAIVSDGDLMEGVASEAASLAGHLQLGKLVCLYDDNRVTLSAGTDIAFSEDCARRFQAYGWHTLVVDDGNDLNAIHAALDAAQAESTRPSLILVRTHIGFGSPEQDSFKAHGSALGVEDIKRTKDTLGWPLDPLFLVPAPALAHFRRALEQGAKAEADWDTRWCAYAEAFPAQAAELQGRLRGDLPAGWDANIPVFATDDKGMASRVAGGQVMNAIASRLPALFGGSADLDPSTHTALKGQGTFNPPIREGEDSQGSDAGGWSCTGRNLHFGVREHAMGAVVNGLAAHGGYLAFGSTFLIFSDYMRPAIRLAALMGLHVVHVFTHDSIALGEDGPTHQPVEQLASLRAMPNLTLIRPADANETAVAWKVAVETRGRPVLLVLSRQDLPTLDRSLYASAEGLRRGAYVLAELIAADKNASAPDLILLASGSEVGLILAAAERLQAEGIAVRCVSMPSWDLFDAQPRSYRDEVLPPDVHARLAVELGASQGWHRYVGDQGDVLGVDRFGASAPADVLMSEYGFTTDIVYARAKALVQTP